MNPTQAQYSALVSPAYNVGSGHFRQSDLLQRLNRGDDQGAADQFLAWNQEKDQKTGRYRVSAGLTNRREAERDLFSGKE